MKNLPIAMLMLATFHFATSPANAQSIIVDGGPIIAAADQTFTAEDPNDHIYNMQSLAVMITEPAGILFDSGGPSGNYGNNENQSFILDMSATTFDAAALSIYIDNIFEHDSLFVYGDVGAGYTLMGMYTNSSSMEYEMEGTPLRLLMVFKSDGGTSFNGFQITWRAYNEQRAFPSINDAGKKMMWQPWNAAFRAGITDSTWNHDKIGFGSTAFGKNTLASKNYAMAWGKSTLAEGVGATAWGNNAHAIGDYSTAWGDNSTASGNHSTAWGLRSNATGNYSTAWGLRSNATGNYSTVWGDNCIASGNHSTAQGEYSNASGNYSTAWGFISQAMGELSTTWGRNSSAMGYSSTAWGYNSIASGQVATAWGNADASGDYATAWGLGATASGYNATAWSDAHASGENATAWGRISEASGDYSTAWGYGTRAHSYLETALGRWNNSSDSSHTWVSTDNLLVVGNGGSSLQRNNAFVLYKDGNAYLDGLLTQGSDRRLKKDIEPLQNAGELLSKINGYTYYWKNTERQGTGRQVGVIAQEVQEVIPDLVKDGENNHMSVNYIGFIPYLIEANKELRVGSEELRVESEELGVRSGELEAENGRQDAIIAEQAEEIERLQVEIDKQHAAIQSQQAENGRLSERLARLESLMERLDTDMEHCCEAQPQGSKGEGKPLQGKIEDRAYLEQNVPNPTGNTTLIGYHLPEGAGKAELRIATLDDKPVKTYALTQAGPGSVTVESGQLPAGTYVYSLIIDNTVLDSKQMVLLK